MLSCVTLHQRKSGAKKKKRKNAAGVHAITAKTQLWCVPFIFTSMAYAAAAAISYSPFLYIFMKPSDSYQAGSMEL